MTQSYLVVLLTLSLTSALLYQVSAFTDPSEVTVLKDLYRELNYPQQLVGWNSSGGDPCEESWKGISCNGSSVIFIQINGLVISGRLEDQLFNLVRLKQLNVSSNHIYGEIPAGLPPNATFMNLSHNSLAGPVGNVFTSLQNLKRMDLSNNNFTGDLSTSFQDLKNLTALDSSFKDFSGDIMYSLTIMRRHLNLSHNNSSSSGPVGNVTLIIVSNALKDDTNVTSVQRTEPPNVTLIPSKSAASQVGPWHGILLLCFLLLAQAAAAANEQPPVVDEQQQPNDGDQGAVVVVNEQQEPDEQQQPNDGDQGAVVVVIEQQEPEEQQPNNGDQGAVVVVVNEGENSWYQEPDSNFRRDGRKESKEARTRRHWKNHPKKEK